METPKLLWLKKHHPQCWERTAKFLDLPDFLVYRATGEDIRSLCSTVCKWTYLGHEEPRVPGNVGTWSDSYFDVIGLSDLSDENYKRIGQRVRPIGEGVRGLSPDAAAELGLEAGTAVGVSIIDAHAGGIGMLGAVIEGEDFSEDDLDRRLALIGGTSSCHMAVSREANFVPGVWGPYYSAMVPGMWLAEGGQSATGALIDHVIFSHSKSKELKERAETENTTVYELLNRRIGALSDRVSFPAELTRDLHVLPYFHGNRSPRANPYLRGMVSGLRLEDSLDELALLYLATIQAIAYGTRHIIEEMNRGGFRIDTIFACGGGSKNPLFLKEHGDITGCRIILPQEPEAVLLGSAILGAVACGEVSSVLEGMKEMNRVAKIIEPSEETESYHTAKYTVFMKMYEDQCSYEKLMKKCNVAL